MDSPVDFIVAIEGNTTTFEAASEAAVDWLLKTGRASATDPRPLVVQREGPGAAVFLEALTRKSFVCRYADGATAERHVNPQANGAPSTLGCGLIGALLLLVPPMYALTKCTSAPPAPPTEAEIAANREAQREEARRDKFNREQAALWRQPASSITEQGIKAELNKCYDAINPSGAPESYLSYPDDKEALDSAKTYGFVKLTGQRSHPFGGVSVQEYTCFFRGAGFERHSTENVGRIKGFVAQ